MFSLSRTYLECGIKVKLSHLPCVALTSSPHGRCLPALKVGFLTLNLETLAVGPEKHKLIGLNTPFTIYCFLEASFYFFFLQNEKFRKESPLNCLRDKSRKYLLLRVNLAALSGRIIPVLQGSPPAVTDYLVKQVRNTMFWKERPHWQAPCFVYFPTHLDLVALDVSLMRLYCHFA